MSTIFKSLTDTVYDLVEGYKKAIEKVTNPSIKQALTQQLSRREQLLETMNQELQRCGEELVTKGTMTGALHRTWMEIADLFANEDEAAIERVEEGEKYLAKKFEESLEHADIDPQARPIIVRGHAEALEGAALADRLEAQVD